MSHKTQQLDRMYRHCAYINTARACAWLGISKSAFYRFLAEGVISQIKRLPGGHIRLDRDTLERIESELMTLEILGERQEIESLPLPGIPAKSSYSHK